MNNFSNHESAHPDTLSFDNLHILIVDDQELNHKLLKRCLHRHGIIFDDCYNGNEALDYLTQHPAPDLILMDLEMPKCDGITAIKKIRKQEAFKNLPVICITATELKSKLKTAKRAGMSAILPKPIEKIALMKYIQQFCSQRQRRSSQPPPHLTSQLFCQPQTPAINIPPPNTTSNSSIINKFPNSF